MKLWGKLICAVTRKHRKGKRVPKDHRALLAENEVVYECPRCGARWTRKVKANAD